MNPSHYFNSQKRNSMPSQIFCLESEEEEEEEEVSS